jgi:hypothetical protein
MQKLRLKIKNFSKPFLKKPLYIYTPKRPERSTEQALLIVTFPNTRDGLNKTRDKKVIMAESSQVLQRPATARIYDNSITADN